MSENPFEAPRQLGPPPEAIRTTGDSELATLGTRFLGSIIDGLLIGALMLPILFVVVIPMIFGVTLAEAGVLAYNPLYILIGFVLGQVIFLLIQGYLLANNGQTVGKLVLRTRIVDSETKQILPFGPLYLKRYFLPSLMYSIPMVGPFLSLINACLIFRGNRKCMHDEIAGTSVINIR